MDLSGLVVWLKICGLVAVVIGWGYLAAKLLDATGHYKSNLPVSVHVFEFGIIGFGLVYVFSIALSLIAALGALAHCTFALIGVVGATWMVSSCIPASRLSWRDCIWVGTLTVFVTYGTIHTVWNYDAGLYHLQAVSYFHQGPVALGIANIYGRLGFTSSWVPLSALCAGPLFGVDGPFLLNGAAMVIFLGGLISHAIEEWRSASYGIAGAYGAGSVLLILSSGALFDWFALSPSADLPSALSCVYAFMVFLRVTGSVAVAGGVASVSERRWDLLLLVCSVALAVTAKSSQAPVLLLVAALVPAGVWRLKDIINWECCKTLLPGVLMILCWLVQGLMASGCLAFPAAISCLGFLPWEVKPDTASTITDLIHNYAKAPGIPADQIPSGLGWLPIWYDKMLRWREFVFSLAWAAAGLQLLGLLAVASALRSVANPPAAKTPLVRPFVFALSVSVAGLLFWFLVAPDPRFGLGFIIAAPALTFAFMAVWGLERDATGLIRRLGVPVVTALAMLAVAVGCYRIYRDHRPAFVWRHEPEPQLQSVVTASGVVVKMPVDGNQCWDARPPCSPEPISTLRQTSFLGHVMYSRSGLESAPLGLDFAVRFGPKTWGRESVIYAGKQHWVRWLQSETEFAVKSVVSSPRQVVLSVQIATLRRPRHAQLVLNGVSQGEASAITQDFWVSGPQEVQFSGTLEPGWNHFLLKSDEPMDPLPGVRVASFLLLDDIRITARR